MTQYQKRLNAEDNFSAEIEDGKNAFKLVGRSSSGMICHQRCIHQWIEAQVVQTPNATAITFNDEHISYQTLNQRANCLAHYLRRLNVGPETLVGLCVDRSPDMIVGLLAILKAGGAYVPLDPSYPRQRIALMLEDAQVSVLLTQCCYLSKFLTPVSNVVCLDTDWEIIAQENSSNLESIVTPDHLAYVIYTSGSTGNPKGVMIEHLALINFVQAASQEYGITSSDRVLQFASICFDAAIEEIFLTLVQGATLVLRPPEMLCSISTFLQNCQDLELTVLDLPTAFWHQICAELPKVNLPTTVQLVIIGGERANPRWLKAWRQHINPQVRLINTYGPTESTVVATYCDIAGPRVVQPSDSSVPIGKPFPNIQIHVLDLEMQPTSVGTTGELYISGAGLARGYLNYPDLTNSRFIAFDSVNGRNRLRLYRTGDLVRYGQDGNLEFIDRIDHQEKIRGFRVELREIETILEQHSAVQEAVVIARENDLGDKRLIAYVVSSLRNRTELNAIDDHWFEKEQVNQWRLIHNDAHFNAVAPQWDTTFNIGGWTSSYTGKPIPEVEMQEWVANTVTRILDLKPQQVLEIGCGTGLLLFRIAPHCLSYLGTDISEMSLRLVKQQLNHSASALSHVSIAARAADDLSGLEPRSFDTIILNSVIQYFPSVSYLVRVLEQILQVIKPGGSIFIGDIRNYLLLDAFAASVELFRASDNLPIEQLRQQIQKRVQQEEELTLDPAFFFALQQHLPQISQVQVLLKRGKSQNELTQFRYDVVLRVGEAVHTQVEPAQLKEPKLDGQEMTLSALRQWLEAAKPPVLNVCGIPNSRVLAMAKTVELLAASDCPLTVEMLRQQITIESEQDIGINPEDLWQLAQSLSYEATIGWSSGRRDGSYNAVLQLRSAIPDLKSGQVQQIQSVETLLPDSWCTYANNPLQSKITHSLIGQLQGYLKQQLPDYMLPSALVLLDALPLTPSGKIDRSALPAPSSDRPDLDVLFVAPRTPLEQGIAEIWSNLLGINEIGIRDNFFALGGDSLRFMQLIHQIESVYQADVLFMDSAQMSTITDLAEQIEKIQNSRTSVAGVELIEQAKKKLGRFRVSTLSEPMTLSQLAAEAVLDETIQPASAAKVCSTPTSTFLTGATGFIGAFLLYELLQQTETTVYCLVRAQTLTQAQQKLHQSLEQYLPEIKLSFSRIIPVLGDLAQPLLGLSEEEFGMLADTVDVIYHSAASVNLLYPYETLKAINVLGTQEILRLASHTKLKPVHYISTLDVFESFTSTGASVVYEQDPIAQGNGLSGGYAQSKWIAEQLVNLAAARGLPTCIYRPGMVTGQSQNGIANPKDLMSRFLAGMIQLQTAPQLELAIDMTPVDYLSQAIVYLSRQAESQGKAFHLVNPNPLTLNNLVHELRQFGYSINQVPYQQWQTILNKKWNALSPLAQVITAPIWDHQLTHLEIWLSGNQLFDCQNAIAGLRHSSISCPPIDAKLLKNYLSYLVRLGLVEMTQPLS